MKCLILLIIVLVGCHGNSNRTKLATENTAKNEAPQDKFKVTVSAGGQKLKNFENELVHRVTLSAKDVNSILAVWPQRLNLPFDGETVRDKIGNVAGVKIVSARYIKGLASLGLLPGDVITAAEKIRISTTRDLHPLFESLRSNGSGSLTLIRRGQPHKLLFSVEGQPKMDTSVK